MVLVDPFHGCKEVDAARGKGSRPLKEIFRQFSQELVPAGWGSDIIEDCVERFLVLWTITRLSHSPHYLHLQTSSKTQKLRKWSPLVEICQFQTS